MIKNNKEYRNATQLLQKQKKMLSDQEKKLRDEGFNKRASDRLLDPTRSFLADLEEDIRQYERIARGKKLGKIENLNGLGKTLISLRIALGMSQREFAKLMKVHETQVSRDETNEYRGITIERASRILSVLEQTAGVRVVCTFDIAAPAISNRTSGQGSRARAARPK
jgi:CRP-like cAMP-binding protein